jgi:hypothetical protein
MWLPMFGPQTRALNAVLQATASHASPNHRHPIHETIHSSSPFQLGHPKPRPLETSATMQAQSTTASIRLLNPWLIPRTFPTLQQQVIYALLIACTMFILSKHRDLRLTAQCRYSQLAHYNSDHRSSLIRFGYMNDRTL